MISITVAAETLAEQMHYVKKQLVVAQFVLALQDIVETH